MKRIAWLVLALVLVPFSGVVLAGPMPQHASPAALHYLSPAAGSQFVPPGTTLALRLDGRIDPRTVSPSLFSLVGSVSGSHSGRVRVADDGATVVFLPTAPFAAGEQVTVNLAAGLATQAGSLFAGLHTNFKISPGGADPRAIAQGLAEDGVPTHDAASTVINAPSSPKAVTQHPQDDVTFPDDFPTYTITVPASGTAPGSLFMAPINVNVPSANGFLFIADDSGEPVYWQRTGVSDLDFKKQPDGSLTYFDNDDQLFHVLDSTYHETETIGAANGYATDPHELQILPNGHALLIALHAEITSTLAFGGFPTATVTGAVIQELDTNGLAVFQWDSFAHIPISDTYVSLTTTTVDYVHANALELDNDGNILLSSRHLHEITKIDRSNSDIIWRLGGKENQFSITDAGGPFSCQHDIRRLPNGDLTLFDNHNLANCSFAGGPSRAVEYQIDETNKVLTNTSQYQNPLNNFAPFTGNNQRLPDGHRLIDWGFSHPNVTEVLTDGTKLFEMTFGAPIFSYRAFRFPWQAVPYWSPTLVLTGNTPSLYYSWNGATDVASYNIYGGLGQVPNVLIGNQPRTGFEDHTALSGLPAGMCAFRVQPVDHEAQPQAFSNIVYTQPNCSASFLPIFLRP